MREWIPVLAVVQLCLTFLAALVPFVLDWRYRRRRRAASSD